MNTKFKKAMYEKPNKEEALARQAAIKADWKKK